MKKLTSSQNKYIRKLLHNTSPVVFIGKQGLSEALIAQISEELNIHEAIKIRFNEYKDQKKLFAKEIASKTNSILVYMVGHTCIYFRQNEEEEERKIYFPNE